MENETVWLTTHQMAMLFDREESNIRRHVINVFKEGELEKKITCIFYTLMELRSLFHFTTSMSSSL